ncbi:MAG: hypothetical protein ACJA0M_000537 [Chitinophagales bacterium]|jgi:hypothetical protein
MLICGMMLASITDPLVLTEILQLLSENKLSMLHLRLDHYPEKYIYTINNKP